VYLRNVGKENQQLREEIERMKLEQARLSEDANMARRIQSLLAFKEQYIESTIAAQVIGTSGSEQSRVLYIDKGSNDGLKTDMAVITPTGIVGKIVQVSASSAQVLPINDQLSGVGASLRDTRLQGILKGASNGTTTLQYIMSDEPVKPGEEVITSGGDRIFPKGLAIGTVAAVEPGKDLFLNIRVTPSARLDRLEEVLVVTKIEEKFPDTKDLGPIRASDILSQRLPGVPTPPDANATGNVTGTTTGGAANPATANPAGSGKPQTPGAGNVKPATPPGSAPLKPNPTTATKPAPTTGQSTVNTSPTTATKPAVRKPPATVTPEATAPPPAKPPDAAENPPQ